MKDQKSRALKHACIAISNKPKPNTAKTMK